MFLFIPVWYSGNKVTLHSPWVLQFKFTSIFQNCVKLTFWFLISAFFFSWTLHSFIHSFIIISKPSNSCCYSASFHWGISSDRLLPINPWTVCLSSSHNLSLLQYFIALIKTINGSVCQVGEPPNTGLSPSVEADPLLEDLAPVAVWLQINAHYSPGWMFWKKQLYSRGFCHVCLHSDLFLPKQVK